MAGGILDVCDQMEMLHVRVVDALVRMTRRHASARDAESCLFRLLLSSIPIQNHDMQDSCQNV
jgi:hypothetical protein